MVPDRGLTVPNGTSTMAAAHVLKKCEAHIRLLTDNSTAIKGSARFLPYGYHSSEPVFTFYPVFIGLGDILPCDSPVARLRTHLSHLCSAV